MKAVKCKNKQCKERIAYINGQHKEITCPKCGTIRKLYTESRGIRFKMAA